MITSLAKFIDWSALQVLTRRVPAPSANMRLAEAVQFLQGPDFIPAASQPARVEFEGSLHFHFPSPRPCEFKENNVVYGRLYRCAGRWQERPTIVLLHGWNSTPSHRYRFPLIARQCNRAGFNAATLELPYHFQRRPLQPGILNGSHYLRIAERTAQAVAEIRSLTGWLLEQGSPLRGPLGQFLWRMAGRVIGVPGCAFCRRGHGRARRTQKLVTCGTNHLASKSGNFAKPIGSDGSIKHDGVESNHRPVKHPEGENTID
jgi:hypothetical protein